MRQVFLETKNLTKLENLLKDTFYLENQEKKITSEAKYRVNRELSVQK